MTLLPNKEGSLKRQQDRAAADTSFTAHHTHSSCPTSQSLQRCVTHALQPPVSSVCIWSSYSREQLYIWKNTKLCVRVCLAVADNFSWIRYIRASKQPVIFHLLNWSTVTIPANYAGGCIYLGNFDGAGYFFFENRHLNVITGVQTNVSLAEQSTLLIYVSSAIFLKADETL